VLYHGVLAPRSAWREEIVPQPKRKPRSDHEHTQAMIRPGLASRRSRWMLWSTLLKRVFEVDALACPLCDQPMRLRAVVLPPTTLRVLDSSSLRAGADLLLLSQILHDWTPQQCAQLLNSAFEAIEPGGTIWLHEKLIDARGGPAANALVDLDMLFWTEGQQLSHADAHAWLGAAGFEQIQIIPTVGYWSVVTARRP
jgi:hypothetical protein